MRMNLRAAVAVSPSVKSRRTSIAVGTVPLVVYALLLFAAPADAATSTIGQLAPDGVTQEYHEGYYVGPYYYPPYYTNVYHPPAALCGSPQDYLQSAVSSGTTYVVPANGERITAWRTNATMGAGQQMTLEVFREVSGEPGHYELVGKNGPQPLAQPASANERGKVNTFAGLSIPVQPGDVVGLYPNAGTTACMFEAGGTYMGSGTSLSEGSAGPFTSASGKRLNLTADVLLKSTGGGPTQHTLTATLAGSGAGTVQSSPAGIEACTSTCSHAFNDGTKVTLSATPDGYSTFAGWSGGGCAGTGACEVTIGTETTVTATFNTSAGSGYGYEYPPGGSYGPPGGGNAGGNPSATAPKCKKRAAHRGRKAHCAKPTRLVAKRAHNANLDEEILTTKKGRTLYSLSAEGGKTFICTAGCLSTWHPLTVPKGIRPIGPVKLGVVTRPEGGVQVTYNGRPLYTFSGDSAPGDTNGQGFKDVGTWGAVVVPQPKH